MKLKNWALVAEIVGAAAVVISLLYVGIQVQDSARAVRSAAVNDANVSLQAWYLNLSSNRQVSELWLDGLFSPEPLEVDDEYQFTMTMHAALLAMQNSFLLAQEGSLDEEILGAITAGLLAIKDMPGWQRYWGPRRGFFYPEFVSYIDNLFAGEASTDAVEIFRGSESEVCCE